MPGAPSVTLPAPCTALPVPVLRWDKNRMREVHAELL